MKQSETYTQPSSDARADKEIKERLEAGSLAAQAFQNPVFVIASNLLDGKMYREWASTDPAHSRERDHLFLKKRAKDEILKLLADLAEEARQILAADQAARDPQQKENEYLDRQGFGLDPVNQ